MKITDIKVRKTFESTTLKAIVSVTFDQVLAVHDIKIIENNGRNFLAMPSKKMQNGEYKDVVHPINIEFRNDLEKIVMDEYKKNLSENEWK